MRTDVEKGVILSAATLLISAGAAALSQGQYVHGAICVTAGVILLFVRENLKMHRWHLGNSRWRGKSVPRS